MDYCIKTDSKTQGESGNQCEDSELVSSGVQLSCTGWSVAMLSIRTFGILILPLMLAMDWMATQMQTSYRQRERVQSKEILLDNIESANQRVNIFAKTFDSERFIKLHCRLVVAHNSLLCVNLGRGVQLR